MLRDLILFLHIASAIHLVGSSFVSPAVLRRVRAAQTRDELRTWIDFFRRATRGNPGSAFTLLGTGIYLGSAGWWSEGWFWVAIAAWLITSALAAGVIQPTAARIAKTAATTTTAMIDSNLDAMRQARGWAISEKLMLGSDLSILWIMVAKPTTSIAIAALAGAMLFFGGMSLLGTTRRTQQTTAQAPA